jgi:outer membrane protein OmpA-like peptidoglycan-associated protein
MPAVQAAAQPHLVPSPEQPPSYRETVSGFTRYSNSLETLPPRDRSKIEAIARRVVSSHRHGQGPLIRAIQIVGHADLDTPRRPEVEQRMSLERALRVRTALAAAIERISRAESSSLPPLPPYSTRIQWDWSGVGASQPAVPLPRNEAERSRNRRVEIILTPPPRHHFTLAYSVPAIHALTPIEMWKAKLENDILEFYSRIGSEDIDRHNCAAAVKRAAEILGASAPKTLKCNVVAGADFVGSKNYRSPLHDPPASLKCCVYNAPCDKEPYRSSCGHCAGGIGPYLILQYHPVLADAVEKVRCVLDRGCLAVAGVLSGICDDKPDKGCAEKLKQQNRANLTWKECPEHWLLIIGYADDPAGRGNYTFVFWDSARMSPLHIAGHAFGLLYYNRTENRLSTGPTLAFMNVDKDGYHPWPQVMPQEPEPLRHWYAQKRYQVLKLGASGPYREKTRDC